MLIRCPQCGTGFNLPAEKIPEKGAKVRCSACTHTFRVRVKNDQPEYFYKKGEAPATGNTMVGEPLDSADLGDKPTVAAHSEYYDDADDEDDDEQTQFGIPQRSKSATGDYNPFPLAPGITGERQAVSEEEARNNSTQMLGSFSEVEELDPDDLEDDDELSRPPGALDARNDVTQLGPQGMAEQSNSDNDSTQFGRPATAAGASGPPPLRTVEDEAKAEIDANDRTQAFGSGGLDLFEGEDLPEQPDEPPPIEIDAFGDAFEEPVGDVGLLMPSTPTSDDASPQPTGLSLESSSEVGISEDDFLRGGGSHDFGDALSLVDNSFGEDVPAFDSHSGVVDVEKRPKRRRRSSSNPTPRAREEQPIELEDVRAKDRSKQPAPKPRSDERPTTERTTAKRTAERSRPAPAYVHQVGSTSPIRRTFDVIFIALVVGIAFVALIAARSGGFVDFARFGHMVEVAFTDTEFQPREDWQKVVEIPPPDPPPDEPLRLQNVRAIEKQLDDRAVLILAGKIRNYSLLQFKGVKVRIAVSNAGEELVARVVTVGQRIDRKKLGAAKTVDEAKAALQKKLPDIGKEGTTYFAFVLDEVPTEVVEAGTYDYSVTVVDDG